MAPRRVPVVKADFGDQECLLIRNGVAGVRKMRGISEGARG